MSRLSIRTSLQSVVIVGEFCGWDVDKAIRAERKGKSKLIHFEDMPQGNYKILSCKSYHGGEVYPTNGKQMPNRYFGDHNETITCYFRKE